MRRKDILLPSSTLLSSLCFARRTQDRVVVGGQKYLLGNLYFYTFKVKTFVLIYILIYDRIFKTVLLYKTTVSLLKLVI